MSEMIFQKHLSMVSREPTAGGKVKGRRPIWKLSKNPSRRQQWPGPGQTRTDQAGQLCRCKEVGSFGVYVDDRSRKVYWQLRHNSLREKKGTQNVSKAFILNYMSRMMLLKNKIRKTLGTTGFRKDTIFS